ILGDGRYEVIPYQGAVCGFAVAAAEAVALDFEGAELGPAQVRRARGLTYVVPVEGAFSYLLSGAQAQGGDLACDRDRVVPGERVVVRGAQEHELAIPADAAEGERIWRELEGKWIDFTVVPLTSVDLALDGDTLHLGLRSNLAAPAQFTVTLAGETKRLRLEPGVPASVAFDLGAPAQESAELLAIDVAADGLRQRIERGMVTVREVVELAPMPARWRGGMRLRGGEETADFGDTRADIREGDRAAGGESKHGIVAHPPWIGATGYVFALWEPVTLPAGPAAALRALVGKGDGSDLGDGILYKLAVIDEAGTERVIAERVVPDHRWLEIEGDLSSWAGRTIRPKLIIDPGTEDNTSGDWACAADIRIESREPLLVRRLEDAGEASRREPPPFPLAGLTVEQLRGARRAWLHYDGMGLSGTGDAYGSFAVLNDVELGNMAPAGGSETAGVWAEDMTVELTPEAIRTLGFRNRFELRNPRRDYFKVRRFWLELELADGRTASSQIAAATFTQPPDWLYAEGIGVPFDENITVDLWFDR
ncbi:MAG: hypothetical protein AB7Y46_16625, partial [Armatimonadota bacterium]